MFPVHTVTAILPCSDLDVSETFYAKLGFVRNGWDDNYRMLFDGKGGSVHLQAAVAGWLIRHHNSFGIYFYAENVDELAASLGDLVLHKPEQKPWGTYEFALSDPDGTRVRVGWPI
jgi:hypothetical protein